MILLIVMWIYCSQTSGRMQKNRRKVKLHFQKEGYDRAESAM
jgi:hypothetical protein